MHGSSWNFILLDFFFIVYRKIAQALSQHTHRQKKRRFFFLNLLVSMKSTLFTYVKAKIGWKIKYKSNIRIEIKYWTNSTLINLCDEGRPIRIILSQRCHFVSVCPCNFLNGDECWPVYCIYTIFFFCIAWTIQPLIHPHMAHKIGQTKQSTHC